MQIWYRDLDASACWFINESLATGAESRFPPGEDTVGELVKVAPPLLVLLVNVSVVEIGVNSDSEVCAGFHVLDELPDNILGAAIAF